MNTIILVRHGRPACDYRTPIRGRAFAEWRGTEDAAPLDAASQPGPTLVKLVRAASSIMTSPLRRSIESARVLSAGMELVTERVLQEADLPCRFPWDLRLSPDVWGMLARGAWLCGWSGGSREGLAAARKRATQAAAMLIERSANYPTIAVVGHGMMNILIARELRRNGWRGPRFPSPRHWSYGVYRR